MKIGELARAAGVGVETIRYYEKEGLLPASARTRSGYRQFGPESLRRLNFIRRARDLGFTLKEVGQLLDLAEDRSADAELLRRSALDKVASIDQRIQSLSRMKDSLQKLIDTCCGSDMSRAECPILEALEGGGENGAPYA